MSTAVELARAEADAVEAAEADAPDAETEQAEQTEEAPPTAKAIDPEKAIAALAKEDEKHARAVERIMGEDFLLVHRCQGCLDFAAGFTLTAPDEAPDFVQPDEYKRCDKCNGYGLLLTGSLTEHGRTQTCLTCNGQGFVTVQPVQPMPSNPAVEQNPMHSTADQLRAQGYIVVEPAPRP